MDCSCKLGIVNTSPYHPCHSDRPLRAPPAVVAAAFAAAALPNPVTNPDEHRAALAAFVDHWMDSPESDSVRCEVPGAPAVSLGDRWLPLVTDPGVRAWALQLYHMWGSLCRKVSVHGMLSVHEKGGALLPRLHASLRSWGLPQPLLLGRDAGGARRGGPARAPHHDAGAPSLLHPGGPIQGVLLLARPGRGRGRGFRGECVGPRLATHPHSRWLPRGCSFLLAPQGLLLGGARPAGLQAGSGSARERRGGGWVGGCMGVGEQAGWL